MNITSSRPVCHRLILVSCALLLAACSGGGAATLDVNGFGQKYKLADNEISGWTQSTKSDSYAVYTPATLTEKIDGQADPYITHGMNFTLFQYLVGPDPQNCTLWAMDFGTEAKAKLMATDRQTTMGASLTVSPYDSSVAMASQSLSGITVFAYFKALYLEIVLDGFGSDVDSARQAGVKFLQVMEAKK